MYVNTLARHRHGRFLRTEPDGGGGGGGGGGQGGGDDFKAITSQEDFDRAIQDRLTRKEKAVRGEYKDYEDFKTKAEQFDVLTAASQTEHEAALVKAREDAWNEAMSKTVPSAIKAEFRAEAKGVLDKAQIDSLLEDLDLLKYATEEGDPDSEKIARKVAAFAPKKAQPKFGQGSGHQTSTTAKGEAGMAEAQRRFPGKVSAAK